MTKNICTLVMTDGTTYEVVRSGETLAGPPDSRQPLVIFSGKEKSEVGAILGAFGQVADKFALV